jgi:hypothetical protein
MKVKLLFPNPGFDVNSDTLYGSAGESRRRILTGILGFKFTAPEETVKRRWCSADDEPHRSEKHQRDAQSADDARATDQTPLPSLPSPCEARQRKFLSLLRSTEVYRVHG